MYTNIIKAQASRGVDFNHGKLREKIRAITTLIIPLFIICFLTSSSLADALEARGYNPSKAFSTDKYLHTYMDVAQSGMNPLCHFIKNGEVENRKTFVVQENIVEDFDEKYSNEDVDTIIDSLHRKVSIIIPIFNAYDEVRKCIRSVLLNTSIDYELILINDCSTDERIGELLDLVGVLPFVRVVNNEVNQGFVKNVNLGIGLSKFDVVLLNSDTVVTPRWLSHLVVCAYSAEDIGTVTPLSNSSDICVEELGLCDDQLSLNANAYMVNKVSDCEYFSSPTGNGFCLFMILLRHRGRLGGADLLHCSLR